jgi:hypothetical protein
MDGMLLARLHGVANALGGLWPLVHLSSFEAVFGPKTDRWLVKTVSGLLIANGFTQLTAKRTPESLSQARRLGLGTAATLAAIDLVYAPTGRISKMYLLDAAMEIGWILAWIRQPPPVRQRTVNRPLTRSRRRSAPACPSPGLVGAGKGHGELPFVGDASREVFACFELTASGGRRHALVNLDQQFMAAVIEGHDTQSSGTEVLPMLLAQSCVRVLGVDGAGISLIDGGLRSAGCQRRHCCPS